MDSQGYPTPNSVLVPYQTINQLHKVFGLMIVQKISNYYDKAIVFFSFLLRFLGNALHSRIFFIWNLTKTSALNFVLHGLGRKTQVYLMDADQ